MKNRLLRRVLKDRRLFHFLLRRASLAQKPLTTGEGFLRHLPFFFGKEHEFRSLPVIARIPFRDLWPKLYQKVEKPRYRVALFGGCLVDFVYPEQGVALMQLLKGQEVQVEYPMGQTCCGLPANMMAEKEVAREVAIQNLAALDPADFDYILTLCASCGSHIKETYPKLLAGEPGTSAKMQQLAAKLIDFSSFFTRVLKVKPERFQGEQKESGLPLPLPPVPGSGGGGGAPGIAGHGRPGIPAHQRRRHLLRHGRLLLHADFPELSAEVLKKKLDAVEETGAELLVTDCPGCVLQLRGGMAKRGGKIKVKHLAEVVAEAEKSAG